MKLPDGLAGPANGLRTLAYLPILSSTQRSTYLYMMSSSDFCQEFLWRLLVIMS